MSEKEQAEELLKKFKSETLTEAQKSAETFVKDVLQKAKDQATEDLKKLKDQYEAEIKAITEKQEATQKHADALDVKLQKGLQKPDSQKSFNDWIGEKLKEVEAPLLALKDTKKEGISFEIKAADTFTIGANYSGGQYDLTSFDPEFARIVRRKPFLRQLVRTVPTSKMYISWAEQSNPQGSPATTAEGAAKPAISFAIVEVQAKVQKIPAVFKVSRESLDDIPYLQSQINQELVELINLTLDTQILSGNGTAPNLKGLLNQGIPTFDSSSATGTNLAGTVKIPNNYDVVLAGVTQIAVAQFTPDYVIVNPIDKATMQLSKDEYGRYVMPPFSTVNGVEVAGVQVIENTGVAQDHFLIGDFKRATLAMREEIGIQIGYENDDFTKNLVTILGEVRAVLYIKNNYLNAFVYGQFSTAKTALASS